MTHRFVLEPYKGMKTRYLCPGCADASKTFSRYIDVTTGNHLSIDVGKCNRVNNCGYHYTPRQYFAKNIIGPIEPKCPPVPLKPKNDNYSIISQDIRNASLKNWSSNNFVRFLITRFGNEITEKLKSKYLIGTSKHWSGATVFWQIDENGRTRTGKIMLYDPIIGRRVKQPYSHITWVHAVLKMPNFNLKQCFFGEHLLKDKYKNVAIVESEKTAVIASIYFPQLLWLAAGSSSNLTIEKFKVLKDRNVILFPDLNCFSKWEEISKQLGRITNIRVSNFLETRATESEVKSGLDLADYLINFDSVEFSQI
jgi:hypothetical protein